VTLPEENFPNLFGNDRYSLENTEGSQSAIRTANSQNIQQNNRAAVAYLQPHSVLQLLLETNMNVKVKEIHEKHFQ
jgi:predicted RNA-binding protein with EMAP domain